MSCNVPYLLLIRARSSIRHAPVHIAEHTKCSFNVYTDPSKHLHKELGFVSHGGYDLLFRAGQPSYSDRGLAGELGPFVKVRSASLLFASESLDETDAD